MSYPIRTEELSKTYRGVAALKGLSLEVPENGIYGLIGPNGAGKSTTIKILMNIIRAASGRAEVLGVDSTRISAVELARIGYVSEDQEAPRWMTVESLMAYSPFPAEDRLIPVIQSVLVSDIPDDIWDERAVRAFAVGR